MPVRTAVWKFYYNIGELFELFFWKYPKIAISAMKLTFVFLIILFIYFGCARSWLLHRLSFSLVATSRSYSVAVVHTLLTWWPLLLRSTGLSYGTRAWLLCSMWDLPDQGSDLCLLHWQVDSLPLSHQGGPKISFLERNF